jgi:hypothetical protein
MVVIKWSGTVVLRTAAILLLPPCVEFLIAQDLPVLDSSVQVTYSTPAPDPISNTIDTQPTFTNISSDTFSGAFSLVITSISLPDVQLANQTCIDSNGRPVIVTVFPGQGLASGQTTSPITLKFSDPTGAAFTFTQTLLAGSACLASGTPFVVGYSDARVLPDDDTLAFEVQLSFPLGCQPSALPSPVDLNGALATITRGLDLVAGPGAFEAFLASTQGMDPKSLTVLAAAATASQNGVGALAALLAAHQNDPQNPAHLANAGAAAALLGLPNEALALLDAADQLGGDFGSPMGISGKAGALNNRGFAMLQLGQYALSQPYLSDALALSPLLAEARTNLGVSYYCLGDTTTGLKYIKAGLTRSFPPLPLDRAFDLSAGQTNTLPPLDYPALPEKLLAYGKYYTTLQSAFQQRVLNQFNQEQMARAAMASDLARLANDPLALGRVNDTLADFKLLQNLQSTPASLDFAGYSDTGGTQLDPRVPSNLTGLYANRVQAEARLDNFLADFQSGVQPLYAKVAAANDPTAQAAACAALQSYIRQDFPGWLDAQGQLEQALRAFVGPYYKAMTGIATNLADPGANQLLSVYSQEIADGLFGELLDYAAYWPIVAGGPYSDPICKAVQQAADSDPPALTDHSNAPECPASLRPFKVELEIAEIMKFAVSCEEFELGVMTPILGPVGKVSIGRQGDWTAFLGFHGDLPPFASEELGLYVKGNEFGLTDVGLKSVPQITAGPITYDTPFGMEASFVDAWHFFTTGHF